MSKLDELIKELCPNGVPHVELGTIAKGEKERNKGQKCNLAFSITKGGLVKTSDFFKEATVTSEDTSSYKLVKRNWFVYSPSRIDVGSINYLKDEELVIVSPLNVVFSISEDKILPQYLLYFLQSRFGTWQILTKREGIEGTGRKLLPFERFATILVPLPPLEVQYEVVRILNIFTNLSLELKAELKTRQKQYLHYREKLLSFDTSNIPLVELRNVVKKSCSGSTPAKGNPEYYANGTIPWIRTQDVRFNEITEVDSYITPKAIEETGVKWIPENCVIVAISGASAGRCAINKIKATTNQHCLNLEIDETKALYKYIYYCVCSKYDELISRKQGARGDLNSSLVLSLQIPVPPIEDQQRIVTILDQFDMLCNDLSVGLPAEIEARQKQYEYYRDQLLTFKQLS